MRIAIIDLGTNTFNLVIASIENTTSYSILFNDKISVKLGEGGINFNKILSVPYERGLIAFGKHLETIAQHKVSRIYAFATSAIRSASNGVDFVKEVKSKYGIAIEVIDGNREAELIYKGVQLAVSLSSNYSLIMDIGGGSTEFIIADDTTIVWKQSFNLGAARLLAMIPTSDPISTNEINTIETYLSNELSQLSAALISFPVFELIGSSGSFDTFAEIITNKFHSPIDLSLHSTYEFDMQEFYTVHNQLLHSTKEDRLRTPGIIEMRVDMIVISSIFTNYVLKKYNLTKMRLSTFALKEGVLSELMKQPF
jgi:exopolyphosphatase/guanosine-5'-triphosphate,3'-diphosphate pyrophosphatase